MAIFVLPDKTFNGVLAGRQFEDGKTVDPVPEAQVELVARILCRYHAATVEGTPIEVALASVHVEQTPEPTKPAKAAKDEKPAKDEEPKKPVSL